MEDLPPRIPSPPSAILASQATTVDQTQPPQDDRYGVDEEIDSDDGLLDREGSLDDDVLMETPAIPKHLLRGPETQQYENNRTYRSV